ncbi:MAG: hypothetical protein MJ051_07010 [Akkermansia sp.]|nr:hypothetical protein [Akkermansia sp.]
MGETSIICKPTADTFLRFGVVLAAFFGFGLYFFYDGSVGYREANEVFCSYHAFAELGGKVDATSADDWRADRASLPLIEAKRTADGLVAVQADGHELPLPTVCEAAFSCPPEAADYEAMKRGWMECWQAYSARRHFPIKPGEHGYDAGAIREQWIAGGVCMLISAVLAYLMLRTRRRVMALEGDLVTAAGQQFRVSEISRLDLRQWGQGFKGVAYATVKGRRVRMDGMTYGGFSKEKGEPAEQWMQALLAQYKGELIEYAAEEKTEH